MSDCQESWTHFHPTATSRHEPPFPHAAWARETTRGLDNADRVAARLTTWVSEPMGKPWDESSAEEVERLIEEAQTEAPRVQCTRIEDGAITGGIEAEERMAFGAPLRTLPEVQAKLAAMAATPSAMLCAQATGKPTQREVTLMRREFERKHGLEAGSGKPSIAVLHRGEVVLQSGHRDAFTTWNEDTC